MRDFRATLLAGALWAAALLLISFPGLALMAAVVCVLTAAGCCVFGGPHRRSRGLGVVVLLCCAALGFGVAVAQPQREALADWDGRAVEVVVEIASSASTGKDGRLWMDATTVRVGSPGSATPLVAPVRIGIDPMEGAELGATLRLVGEAKKTDAGERAAAVVFARRAEVVVPASGVFALAAQARADFVSRAGRLPEPGAGLLPGLAVGDTRAVSEPLAQAMRDSGLSHLTAVSGANCAIVVGAVFWLVGLCGGGRTLRVVLALAALAAFVVLVTPEPSVIRAGVMAALAMLTVLLGRPSAGLAMLSVAVSGILLADPWLASSPGFALSVAATGALLLLARPLLRALGRWMPHPLALAVSVPLAAQVVCGPIVALFAEQQSLVGVAANLLAAPAAPVATVIGLLACLAAPLPELADLFAAAAWLPAAWIASTAHVSAGLPAATVRVEAGPVAALGAALLSGAVAVALIRPRNRWLCLVAAGVLVVAVGLGGGRMLLTGPLAPLTSPGEWSVAACDVGQGDAVLVRSAGRVALIDTGPEPEALRRCLSALAVSRIDLLVLTHFDLDHAGGVPAVLGMVGTAVHGPPGEADDHGILRGLESGGAELVAGAVGTRGMLGGARWSVLWPVADSTAFPPGNDASVVIEIAGGGVPRTLFLGDLSAAPQRLLLYAGRVRGGYDVVKVAHHGSRDQEAELYRTADAAVALISVGAGNDYGHPRSEILSVLDATGARVFRTDQQGRVLLSERDGRLAVWTERAPPPGE
ncbi:ComEC/Rec2 family competence protein [Microbacterium sp.]|uniref:ComEC/Rec2 family competence protein n=1 Tax=Microbacterium sp. TaxID=51671 RepID=UPI0028126D55|nr:ComEC/Rec2 family competence protein [Microbacterium sp.]